MKARRALEERELAARIAATDPTRDAWVSANAGSGKTRILRNRVIRLMLDGTPPDRILCLTYTRAAAAEMQGRIFAELARWVTLDDAALDEAIGELVSLTPQQHRATPRERAKARGLFARAIEAPGGLKVQTIHAFAERVLHLFPIEAGVPLDFAILMEDEARKLADAARRETLEAALAAPGSVLGKAFGEILEAAGLPAFGEALDEALAAVSRLALENRALPAPEIRVEAYRKALRIPPHQSLSAIETRLLLDLDGTTFEHAASVVESQKKLNEAQRKLAARLNESARTLKAEAPDPRRVCAPFLTETGVPGRRPTFTKDVLALAPELAEFEAHVKAVWLRYFEERHAFLTFTRSLAMASFTEEVRRRYGTAKTARSLLDFDDLIGALRRLLTSGQAAWVLFKLDGGIDHVLIDEAQDTTRAMWEIVAALTDEFFAGEGARQPVRTLFVVGDEKQSIYSFQGADPAVFEEYRQRFGDRSPRGELIRRPVPLTYSFRSSDDVLGAVDAVFAPEENRRGLTARGEALEHRSADSRFPGHVEFWPPARASELNESAGHIRVAQEIARTIAGWLSRPERHLVDGRPLRPGDILILVRVRNAFFEAVRAALKAEGVPVAGADRLTLQSELVIQDLLALAQAVLVPEDDLALACVLKSPLFGVAEAALESLARGREGTLRAALAQVQPTGAAGVRWDRFAAWLDALAAMARRSTPFDFFAQVLSGPAPACPQRSVKAVLADQFGAEIGDPLNEFLHQALTHAQEGAGALLPFVLAQQSRQTELKRDAEAAQDKVRVMTVHGAKGLEGRIVFLADAHGVPEAKKDPKVLLVSHGAAHALLLWSALPRQDEPDAMAQERARRRGVLMGEYRRLLYVGMTRAADRLYVTSHARRLTKKEIEQGQELADPEDPMEASWYQMLRRGLQAAPAFGPEETLHEALPPRRKQHLPTREPVAAPQDVPAPAPRRFVAPDWLRRPLPDEQTEAVLTPSSGIAAPQGGDGEARPFAQRRGIVLHKLFELLPRVAPEARESVGLRLLALIAPDLAAEAHAPLLAPVLGLLNGEWGMRWFGPDSRAEVAISGDVDLNDGRRHAVRGRIDRLLVTPEGVDIIDLKTGRARRGDEDAGILRQMALYRALLRALYPGRPVRCHLVWLEAADVEALSAAALDAAFALLSSCAPPSSAL